jgi:hypothetical protein
MKCHRLLIVSMTSAWIVVGALTELAAAAPPFRFSTQQLATAAQQDDTGLRTLLHVQLDRTGTRDVVYGSDETLEIFFNPTRGPAVSGVARFGVDGNLRGVVSGDFNGDRITDLAVISHATGRIQIFYFGTAGRVLRQQFVAAGPSPQSIVAGDLNQDGRDDFAFTHAIDDGRDAIATLINEGDSTFRRSASTPVGRAPFGLAAADLDGDGSLDLAAANALSNTVSVLLNDGTGAFPSATTLAVGEGPWDVALADLDRDGLIDVVTTNAVSLDVAHPGTPCGRAESARLLGRDGVGDRGSLW